METISSYLKFKEEAQRDKEMKTRLIGMEDIMRRLDITFNKSYEKRERGKKNAQDQELST